MSIKRRILSHLTALFVPALLAFPQRCPAASESGLGLKTVVIDAGHGGKDAGSISKNRKVHEKTLNLKIATLLSGYIRQDHPDVKVILTRRDDRYLTLGQRADIANRNNADLFISVHINSVKSVSPNGFSIHVLGQSAKKDTDLFSYNMEVCKRENSVIMLEDDYTTKYQGFDPDDPQSFIFFSLMQNSHLAQSLEFAELIDREFRKGPIKCSRGVWQDPFYLLWKTTMPAVLIECGFISNDSDLKIMNSEEGQRQIARRIADAFSIFKKSYDGSLRNDSPSAPVSASGSSAEQQAVDAVSGGQDGDSPATYYGTQIFSLSRQIPENDPRLLGKKAKVLRTGNVYKYVIGVSESESEARKAFGEIRREYPDAYMVEVGPDGTSRRIK